MNTPNPAASELQSFILDLRKLLKGVDATALEPVQRSRMAQAGAAIADAVLDSGLLDELPRKARLALVRLGDRANGWEGRPSLEV